MNKQEMMEKLESLQKKYDAEIADLKAQIQAMPEDDVPDWDNLDDTKYSVVFDYREKKYTAEYDEFFDCGVIYFSSEEIAQKCADWLNQRRKETDNHE